MAQLNPTGHLIPAQPIPPEGFMEYFALLLQNGSISLPMTQPSSQPLVSPVPALPGVPLLSTKARSFNQASRGTGGVLVEKKRYQSKSRPPPPSTSRSWILMLKHNCH